MILAPLPISPHTLTPAPELARLLEEHVVGAEVARAAVAGVAWRDGKGTFQSRGASAGSAHLDTPFDLASLTKPFVAVTVSLLVERARLTWATRLDELLPTVAGCPAGAQSLEALLSHRAGLVPHLELFRDSWAGVPIDRQVLLRRAASALRADGGSDALYSDLGYLLVGAALAHHLGCDLDALVTAELLAPLDLRVGSARMWRRSPHFERNVAPTELQPGRGGLLVGQVHDDNAWALSGAGLSGHAGLFGTLGALLSFGTALLEGCAGRGLLSRCVSTLLQRRPGGSLLLGFDSSSGPASLAGLGAGPATFGHLGFTGTSIWCDPERDIVTVLLTNRVHPSRANPRIRPARLRMQEFLWTMAAGAAPTEASKLPGAPGKIAP